MRVDVFDFDLPDDRIALRPAEPRDAARLLVVKASGHIPPPPTPPLKGEGDSRAFASRIGDGDTRRFPSPLRGGARGGGNEGDDRVGETLFSDRVVRELPDLLRPGDALVFNDTKVIPAQLFGIRARDGQTASIEATLHMRAGSDRWKAFLRPAKRVKVGERIRFGRDAGACALGALDATVAEKGEGGEALLVFDLSGPALDDAIRAVGHTPLPPYIAGKRGDDARDLADYQTIYARAEGAVAAPTAGLHFTPELFAALDARGVSRHFVTLHVGAGTFLPVKADDTADHRMHAETGEISAGTAAALNAARARGGRIVAVGTTSLRLMESSVGEDGLYRPWAGSTTIFITPGHRFRTADLLMTNFHLPRSTLFMLVSAFSGLETMRAAYAHAIASGYRFYSYGDACLLERAAQENQV